MYVRVAHRVCERERERVCVYVLVCVYAMECVTTMYKKYVVLFVNVN